MTKVANGLHAELKLLKKKIARLEEGMQVMRELVELQHKSTERSPKVGSLVVSPKRRFDGAQQQQMLNRLSPRELQVLRLFSEIRTCKKIANALGTEPQTVRNQLVSARKKLGASSRDHLLEMVIEMRPWLDIG